MSQITGLLSAIDQGDPEAQSKLLSIVNQELHSLAVHHMAGETPGHTLQPGDLVNEAYLRLFGSDEQQHWENRRHFFAAAARAMREILVDRARQKAALKRGGRLQRVDLDKTSMASEDRADQLLAVHEALEELARHNPQAARLVELRYFGGYGHQEAAGILKISRGQADDLWVVARARLRMTIEGQ